MLLSSEASQIVERAFAANPPAAQEHETIADASGVGDLMNRQHQRASAGGVVAQRRGDLTGLAQIEPFERFVGEKHGLRRQQPESEKRALALALRQGANPLVQ